jgi:hypothetical protein
MEIAPRRDGFAGRWLAMVILLGVCAASGHAEESSAAKVLTLNGQVSVLRDNAPWALNVGDSVQPRQIIITGADGYALLQVSDGSTFEVFPNARVIFRDNPGNWKDLLEVLLGRVKVQIQKIGGQPNYNKVRTPTAVISVRGTIFDVSVEDEDATTLVTVDEGQVEVRHALLPQKDPKILNPGEWVRVFKNQPLIAKNMDKSGLLRGAMRAAADAVYKVVYRSARVPSGTGGGVTGPGGGGPGGSTGGGTGGGVGVGDCKTPGGCKGSGTGAGQGDSGTSTGTGGSTTPPPPPPPPHH